MLIVKVMYSDIYIYIYIYIYKIMKQIENTYFYRYVYLFLAFEQSKHMWQHWLPKLTSYQLIWHHGKITYHADKFRVFLE